MLLEFCSALARAMRATLVDAAGAAFGTPSNPISVTMSPSPSETQAAFVYRPGGPLQSGAVYTNWADLYAAVNASNAPRVIAFDSSYAPCVIPAGAWNLAGVIFTAWLPLGAGVGPFVSVTVTDGAKLIGLRKIQGNLNIGFTGVTCPVDDLASGDQVIMADGARLTVGGAAPFFRSLVPAFLILSLVDGAAFVSGPCLDLAVAGSGLFVVTVGDFPALGTGTLTAVAGNTAEIVATNASANPNGFSQISESHPGFAGTIQFLSSFGRWNVTTPPLVAAGPAGVGAVTRYNPTGGTFQISLPPAFNNRGQVVQLANASDSRTPVTLLPAGADTIDGQPSAQLAGERAVNTYVSDGTATWIQVGAGIAPFSTPYQWRPRPSLLRARGRSGVLLRNGDVLCAGGQFDADVATWGQTERLQRAVGYAPIADDQIGTEVLGAATSVLPDGSVLYAGGFSAETLFGSSSRATAIYKDGVFSQSYKTKREILTVPLVPPYTVALSNPGALLDLSPNVDLNAVNPPPNPLQFPGTIGAAFEPGNTIFTQTALPPAPGEMLVDTVLNTVTFDASAAGLEVAIDYRYFVAAPGPGVPAPLPAGRSLGSLFLSPDGTKVLNCLGFNGTSFFDWTPSVTASLYDIATGLWAATGSMATPHASGEPGTGILRADGKVVVTGGWDLSPFDPGFTYANVLSTTEVYDFGLGAWAAGAPLTMPRSRQWLTMLPGGDLLLGGGGASDLVSSTKSVERYYAARDQWASVGETLVARSSVTPIYVNGSVVLIGGFAGTIDESISLDSAEAYNATVNASRDLDIPAQNFVLGAGFVGIPDSTVLCIGGSGASPPDYLVQSQTVASINPDA